MEELPIYEIFTDKCMYVCNAQRAGCGGWTRTSELLVMSQASYHCSTPPYKIKVSCLKCETELRNSTTTLSKTATTMNYKSTQTPSSKWLVKLPCLTHSLNIYTQRVKLSHEEYETGRLTHNRQIVHFLNDCKHSITRYVKLVNTFLQNFSKFFAYEVSKPHGW